MNHDRPFQFDRHGKVIKATRVTSFNYERTKKEKINGAAVNICSVSLSTKNHFRNCSTGFTKDVFSVTWQHCSLPHWCRITEPLILRAVTAEPVTQNVFQIQCTAFCSEPAALKETSTHYGTEPRSAVQTHPDRWAHIYTSILHVIHSFKMMEEKWECLLYTVNEHLVQHVRWCPLPHT